MRLINPQKMLTHNNMVTSALSIRLLIGNMAVNGSGIKPSNLVERTAPPMPITPAMTRPGQQKSGDGSSQGDEDLLIGGQRHISQTAAPGDLLGNGQPTREMQDDRGALSITTKGQRMPHFVDQDGNKDHQDPDRESAAHHPRHPKGARSAKTRDAHAPESQGD